MQSNAITKVLIVDDEDQMRHLLKSLMEMNGYKCSLSSNANDAKRLIVEQDFDLVLCDVNMPGESGLVLAETILNKYPGIALIMVSAIDDPEIAEACLSLGAYGYIIKPFKANELIINVSNALRRRKLEIANLRHRETLEQKITKRTYELNEILYKMQKTMRGIIQSIALTVETRDPYTAGHQRRVADLARSIATEMNIPDERIEGVWTAGFIHDLGKISVPAEILSKPYRLSKNEFGIIKEHPKAGSDILAEVEFPWPISKIVLQHHERLDGSGYPQGLSGDDILLEARILSVADVVEAMASHRPYRPSLGIDAALEEISHGKDKLYDSNVVDSCIKLFSEKKFEFK